MSINNKPHQSEPFTVREPDGFGGVIERVSDAWYNYLESIDRNINVNIIQNTTNTALAQTNTAAGVEADVARLFEADKALTHLVCQLLTSQDENTRLRKDLADIRAELASLRIDPAMDMAVRRTEDGLASVKQQVAQLQTSVNHETFAQPDYPFHLLES